MDQTNTFIDKYFAVFSSNTVVRNAPWLLPYNESFNRYEYNTYINWYINGFIKGQFVIISYDKIKKMYYTTLDRNSPVPDEVIKQLPKLVHCKDFKIFDNNYYQLFETPNPIDILVASIGVPTEIVLEVIYY
jgi:hypothetical protein